MLAAGGWREVDVQPIDVACAMPDSGLQDYLTRLGPVGAMLADADPATRTRVYKTIRPAFDPYVRDGRVCFTAACWCVDAWA